MKLFLQTILFSLLTSCAYYQGLHDKSAPIPADQTNKKIVKPQGPNAASPTASPSNAATNKAASMLSPVTH